MPPQAASAKTTLAYEFALIDNVGATADSKGDGKGDVIVVYPFTVEKVSYVGSKTFSTEAVLNGSSSNVKYEDVVVYDGIADDDYVKVTAAGNTANNVAVFEELEVVAATADATKTNQVSFNNVWYKTNMVSTPAAGADCEYVAVNGYIFYVDAPSDTAGAGDFVLVTAAASNVAGLDNTATAKILKADGNTETVEVAKIGGSAVGANNMPAAGTLYTYEVNDDGYYELKAAASLTAAETDYDYVNTSATYNVATSDNDGYITANGKKYIDDDAVIFVDEGEGDYSVTTGAKLKATKTTVRVNFVAADNDTNAVYSDVKLAYVVTGALGTSDSAYAYVTDEVAVKADGDKFYAEIPVGEDTVLKTKSVSEGGVLAAAQALAEGDVFEYTLNADGIVESISEFTMDKMVAADASASTGDVAFYAAIIANKGNDICFSNALMTAVDAIGLGSTSYNAKMTEDTVVIFVDNANYDVAEGGTIRLADSEKIGDATGFYANVKAVVDASNEEIQLLVVDVYNDMLGIR